MKIVVAPLAGARIEIDIVSIGYWNATVAPLAGARIEISKGVDIDVEAMSLPSRERGLKFALIRVLRLHQVAPLAGARIEIHRHYFSRILRGSLPSRERGLKFQTPQSNYYHHRRSPRGSAD